MTPLSGKELGCLLERQAAQDRSLQPSSENGGDRSEGSGPGPRAGVAWPIVGNWARRGQDYAEPDRKGAMILSGHYSMTDARNHLSQVVHEAESEGPVVLTRRGRAVAVVLAEAEFERLRSTRLGFWEATLAFRSSVDLSGRDIDEVYRDVRDRTAG